MRIALSLLAGQPSTVFEMRCSGLADTVLVSNLAHPQFNRCDRQGCASRSARKAASGAIVLALRAAVRFGMVRFDLVRFGMVRFDLARFHMANFKS
jgi:hypothetical protein